MDPTRHRRRQWNKKPPRGRGLRTTTGCKTCRRRHIKCDEQRPKCGPCLKAQRDCNFSKEFAMRSRSPFLPPDSESTKLPGSPATKEAPGRLSKAQERSITRKAPANRTIVDTESEFSYAVEEASLTWLDIVTENSSNVACTCDSIETGARQPALPNHSVNCNITRTAAALTGELIIFDKSSPAYHRANHGFDIRQRRGQGSAIEAWHSTYPISLQGPEMHLFTVFVDCLSHWLDIFDPLRHFSTLVPQLALQNEGLLKAILALSSRYVLMNSSAGVTTASEYSIQFYNDTLHWLHNAMNHETFGHSPELVATALILSTYEMMDEVGSPWGKHLKGLFWIQRSLDSSGESGGLRQAVWWAWLRQDIWAAFREGRKCFSFFRPRRPYYQMNQYDIANRSAYLLSRVINFCSDEENAINKSDPARRILEGRHLGSLLDEWSESSRLHFNPLPVVCARDSCCLIEPMCIRPSEFAAAIQMSCFARTLLLVHSPCQGIEASRNRQTTISELATTICRLAIALKDVDAALLISTQCVFAAGLFCEDPIKRELICNILDAHQRKIKWPGDSLCEELRQHWKDEFEAIS